MIIKIDADGLWSGCSVSSFEDMIGAENVVKTERKNDGDYFMGMHDVEVSLTIEQLMEIGSEFEVVIINEDSIRVREV